MNRERLAYFQKRLSSWQEEIQRRLRTAAQGRHDDEGAEPDITDRPLGPMKKNSPFLLPLNTKSACGRSSTQFAASVRASMGSVRVVAKQSTLSDWKQCHGHNIASNAKRIWSRVENRQSRNRQATGDDPTPH